MSVALGMSSALNDDVAFRNMDIILLEYTLIALDTSHFEWSALNDVAFWTMEIILDCILVTLERPRSREAVLPSQLYSDGHSTHLPFELMYCVGEHTKSGAANTK